MATLEQTKFYGLQERTQTLMDLSRNRLNSPTPHQAPQRERVSMAAMPISAQETRRGRRRKHKRWPELLRPDYNMGVPQLMMILEPNIVWDHVQGVVAGPAGGQEVEAQYCPGDFFEGWHKGGRSAHGVYEGSYWELIGDCEEMMDMLRKMANAPPLEEEPPLELPAAADLPKWEEFKPVLQALPSSATLPQLRLPPFRAPILDTELPFIEPDYVPLPEVPDAPQEEPLPVFFPPEVLSVEAWQEPEFQQPEPPVLPEAPLAPAFGKPQYGHDWSGTRPYVIDEPAYVGPRLLDVPQWMHPPRNLPKLPVAEDLQLDRADMDLDPLPRLELAWECGPDPEPAFASIATTPLTMSRAPSPPRSRPSSAVPSQPSLSTPSTRPTSALRPPPGTPKDPTPAPTPPRPMSAAESIRGPSTWAPSPPPPPSPPAQPSPPSTRASTPPRVPSPPHSPPRQPSPPREPPEPEPAPEEPSPLAAQPSTWEEVGDVDAGKPRVWLNFDKPFAELPPVFMPPRPELGVSNGPEPQPDDFPVDGLEDVPRFQAPAMKAMPQWSPAPLKTPSWCPPCEPRPIGFMRGTAPVLIIDVSGTMNPRQRGKFPDMKECVCELLHPQGELATAAGAFDVIAFCNMAWAWSATYSQRMSLLASAQIFYSGRQVGGKIAAGSKVAEKTKAGAQLMPTEPDLLEDARNWVKKWPDAVGHTSLLSSFLMADEHWNADCWYVFSDGLADDPMQCHDFIETRIRHGQRTPIIHTILFLPEGASENFEGRRFLQKLSAMTGGTFQEYDPTLHRIYKDGEGFVNYDPSKETEEVAEERMWAEEQLRAERKKNIRLGIAEPLDVTLARVQALHHQMRVQPLLRDYQERTAKEQAAYEAEVEAVRDHNENAVARAAAAHKAEVAEIEARNMARKEAARRAYEEARVAWLADYERAVQEWEDTKANLEKERAEALAALEALQVARSRSRTPSPPRSRPVSARPSGAGGSRPTSARKAPDASPSAARPMSAQRSRPTSAVPRPQSATAAAAPTSPSAPVMIPTKAEPLPSSGSAQAAAAVAMAASAAWGGDAMSPAHALANEGVVTLEQVAAEADARQSRAHSASSRGGSQAGVASSSADAAAAAEARPGSASTSSPSRPASGRPMSGSQRPLSATGGSASKQRRPSSGTMAAYAALAAGVTSSLQQLLEEGEEEMVSVEGQPSGLSLVHGSSGVVGGESAADAATVADEAYDAFDEDGIYEDEPPALEFEDSQELKRRIFPAEVVAALDAENAARLEEIRDEWGQLLADCEARNARKLELLARNQAAIDKYEADVIARYAESFVKEAVMGTAVRTTANMRLVAQAQAAHEAEVARVRAENARVAELHRREVEDKVMREEQHRMAVERWETARREARAQHEADLAEAKRQHVENVTRLRSEWEAHKAEVEAMNNVRMREAEMLHAKVVEDVVAANKRFRAEHAEKIKARKAVEAENLARQAEARAAHQAKLEALAVENEGLMKQAQDDHQALCERLAQEHEEACKVAEKEFQELRQYLAAHNEGLMEEARRKHAEAVAAALAEFEAICAAIRAAHEEELARVRAHNEAIWPQVQRARLALAELGRVQAFAEHIKFCANKLQLGINFMGGTPSYDRVVEMQALNESLAKAFPDYEPQAYPWPGHERRREKGTGWVESPATKQLDIRDPAQDIMRIVAGKSRPASASAARPASARPATASAAGATVSSQVQRPMSAMPGGVGVVTSTTTTQAVGPQLGLHGSVVHESVEVRPTSASTPTRPLSASRPRFGSVAATAAGAARPVSTGRRPTTAGGAASPTSPTTSPRAEAGYAEGGFTVGRSSLASPRASILAAAPSPAPGALSGVVSSTRPGSALRPATAAAGSVATQQGLAAQRSVLAARALSAGPTLASAAMASAPSMSDPANRPVSGAATAKGPGGAARPVSARLGVPARMSADLAAMQQTIAKYRSPKAFNAPAVQQAAAVGGQKFAQKASAFRSDFPRLQYPSVDVRALDA